MTEARLTIPLSTPSPARQRFWRAVWLVMLVIFGIYLGLLLYRLITFHNRTLAWPKTATTALRLLKTPENLQDIANAAPGLMLDTQLPLVIEHELLHAKTEIVIFFDANGRAVGLATDRKLSNQDLQAFALLGITSKGDYRIKTLSNTQEIAYHRTFAPWLLLPIYDGSISQLASESIKSCPITLNDDSLIARISLPNTKTSTGLFLNDQATILANLAVSPEIAQGVMPNIPAVYPGIKDLVSAMTNGFSMIIGTDDAGLAYSFSLESSTINAESLGKITKELVQLQDLSRQDWTNDQENQNQLRGPEVKVDIAHDLNLNRVIATGPSSLVRATQADNILVISNRTSSISEKNTLESSCLSSAVGFLAPQQLRKLAPEPHLYQAQDISTFLQQSELVSWSKSKIKFCW